MARFLIRWVEDDRIVHRVVIADTVEEAILFFYEYYPEAKIKDVWTEEGRVNDGVEKMLSGKIHKKNWKD